MDGSEEALANLAADRVYGLSPGCFCRECVRRQWRKILSILKDIEVHEHSAVLGRIKKEEENG